MHIITRAAWGNAIGSWGVLQKTASSTEFLPILQNFGIRDSLVSLMEKSSTREGVPIKTSHKKLIPRPGLSPNIQIICGIYPIPRTRTATDFYFAEMLSVSYQIARTIGTESGFLVEAFVGAFTNYLLTRTVPEPGCTP